MAIGPPIVNPPNSSLRRGGSLSPCKRFWKFVMAFRYELFSEPKMLPCQSLPPDFVTMFTTEPELRPYSGPNWLVTRTYCCTNSGLVTNRDGPATLLSLLFWPSICWSLFLPRSPLEENPWPPLKLEKLLSREETTPGTNRARLSKPWFS